VSIEVYFIEPSILYQRQVFDCCWPVLPDALPRTSPSNPIARLEWDILTQFLVGIIPTHQTVVNEKDRAVYERFLAGISTPNPLVIWLMAFARNVLQDSDTWDEI
jgi:hypothetical protein